MTRCPLTFFLLCLGMVHAQELRMAPHPDAVPANQLLVAGNACGPAALLSAFRFGDEDWQKPLAKLNGTTDREQMLAIIRQYGGRQSNSIKGHQRWSKRGVNLADLTDIGNEMGISFYLPKLTTEVFFAKPGELPEKFLDRTHDVLRDSLKGGFPPILSVRRFVHRGGQWTVIEAHFVTLIGLPDKLEKGAISFPISYLDPWGGKRCQGEITTAMHQLPPGLPSNPAVNLPNTGVGKKLVKPGESSVVVLSAAIGR